MKITGREHPLSFLVVDDDPIVRSGIAQFLRSRFGCTALEADSGEAALAQPVKYGAVITDIEMPGMGGMELIRRLREAALTQTVPILVMSGRLDPDLRGLALRAGASAFLDKPFAFARLAELILAYVPV